MYSYEDRLKAVRLLIQYDAFSIWQMQIHYYEEGH